MTNTHAAYQTMTDFMAVNNLSRDAVPTLDPSSWQALFDFMAEREHLLDILRHTTLDVPDVLIFIFDEAMRMVAINQVAARTLGFEDTDALIGLPLQTFLATADLAESKARFEAALRGEIIPEYERTLHRPDGSEIQTRVHVSLIESQLSGKKYIKSVMRDVTQLRAAQAAAAQIHQAMEAIQASTQRTRDHLQAIVNNSSDGIVVTTLEGDIAQTNPAFDQLLNLDHDAAFAHPLDEFIDAGGQGIFQQALQYALTEKQSVRFEVQTTSPNQELPPIVDVSCSPILTPDDEITGLVFSLRDVTAYREMLSSLSDARDAALQLSRLKSEFLAMMSHEIRTPLHAIMGLMEILADSALDDGQQELVTSIDEQANFLLDMLNTILDYSKLEARKMILEQAPFTLQDVLMSTVNGFRGQIMQKDLSLVVNSPLPLPLAVIGDSRRLRQVLSVLLSNAIKFTDHGTITVTTEMTHQTTTSIRVHFTVGDTGVGIPQEKIDTLFSPFVQADSSHTRSHGGTGLGLAIAKRVLELMNSTMTVESRVGAGSTFAFTLDYPLADT